MEPKQAEDLSKLDEPEASKADDALGMRYRIQQIKNKMADQGITLTAEDLDGLQSYLVSEQKWEEVYCRLADS
ncbi:MAG: hypothetical protein KME59_17915 [Trichormus sp. ATA11-4-KO1]|jgi:hypothetical protein|nr:hypothetical protein [Trichormus sp. ATA11-4-KO1]